MTHLSRFVNSYPSDTREYKFAKNALVYLARKESFKRRVERESYEDDGVQNLEPSSKGDSRLIRLAKKAQEAVIYAFLIYIALVVSNLILIPTIIGIRELAIRIFAN